MALTHVPITISNLRYPKKNAERKFLVDSGAVYSVVPGADLKALGITPNRTMNFILADGTTISRQIGDAVYEYAGTQAASPVVFGEKGDLYLLGAVTLESMGLVLNPLNRELKPMQAILA